jgi:hypothetical protein
VFSEKERFPKRQFRRDTALLYRKISPYRKFSTQSLNGGYEMTIEIEENVDLHHQAEMELVCPWCHTNTINTVVNHGALRLKCHECGMDAFVTRIPRDKKLADYISRRLIV